MSRLLHICLIVALLGISSRAFADGDPPALECSEYVPVEERNDPKRLALRGVACFESKKYVLAIRHYRRARELSDSNLLNAALGRTFHELGYPFIARRYYRDYLSGKIEDTQGREKIQARLEDVDKQLESTSKVRVESSPPGATVFVVIGEDHWEDLGETPIDLEMRPGKQSFIVEHDGYVRHTASVDVGSKQGRIVQAQLVEEGAAFAVSGQRLRRSGIITMGAAVPFLIIGPSLYLIGRNDRGAVDELPPLDRPDATKRATRTQNWGIVSTVVGVAALGTGLTLYLAGRSADRSANDEDAPKTPAKTKKPNKKAQFVPYVDGRTAGFVVLF